MAPKRLPWSEVEKLAASVRELLTDPDAELKDNDRRRWEGALTALEAVLGVRKNDLL